MAALTPSLQQSGRLSVSATAVTTAGPDTISNAALLAIADDARGPLYNFLNTTFGSAALAVAAFAAKGGILNVSSTAAAPDVAWALDGGKPSLALSNTTNAATCSIRIALSYSAQR
jgi:hypothetical protein